MLLGLYRMWASPLSGYPTADCRKLIKTVRAVPSIFCCNTQARTVESKSPKSTRAFASPLLGAQQNVPIWGDPKQLS